MEDAPRRNGARWVCLALALLALGQGGCLAVAGVCAAGALCHSYYKGKVNQTYFADMGDALAATKTALAELGMPIEKEEHDTKHVIVHSRAGNGDKIRIDLKPGKS